MRRATLWTDTDGSHSAAFAACPWLVVSKSQTISSAVVHATQILSQKQVPEAAESAQYLAAHCFPHVQTRLDVLASRKSPPRDALNLFIQLCKERERKRTPIQYLVGDWDFHSITLLVRPPVLIPRPETEELVEHVLNDLEHDSATILDVGCGSGAILLAILNARPNWSATGIDISEEAVKLSEENVRLLGMQSRARIGHARVRDICGEGRLFDALVSNPPYIPVREMDGLQTEVRDHEDYGALCGGEDGLDVVLEVLHGAAGVLKPGGSIWLEVDTPHPSMIEAMKFKELEYVKSHNDLSGNARFCHLRRIKNVE
ncbi:unnamed protein product [Agarophyton chilense]